MKTDTLSAVKKKRRTSNKTTVGVKKRKRLSRQKHPKPKSRKKIKKKTPNKTLSKGIIIQPQTFYTVFEIKEKMKDNIEGVFEYITIEFRDKIREQGYRIIGKSRIMPVTNYKDPLKGLKYTITAKVEKIRS